jgi:hypothetical protein
MEHNMKLQILTFRSLLPGADSYRPGITFDRVEFRKETPGSYLALEPDLRGEKNPAGREGCLCCVVCDGFVRLQDTNKVN